MLMFLLLFQGGGQEQYPQQTWVGLANLVCSHTDPMVHWRFAFALILSS